MNGMEQLFILTDEYLKGMLMPQDYKHNVVALIKSFTEDELKDLANLIIQMESGRGH
jgi:hypothetical protein